MVKLKDIRSQPYEEKEKVYDEINGLYLQGKAITVREYRSGFPAVTVNAEHIHILTDILSLELWWKKKKEAA